MYLNLKNQVLPYTGPRARANLMLKTENYIADTYIYIPDSKYFYHAHGRFQNVHSMYIYKLSKLIRKRCKSRGKIYIRVSRTKVREFTVEFSNKWYEHAAERNVNNEIRKFPAWVFRQKTFHSIFTRRSFTASSSSSSSSGAYKCRSFLCF